MLALPSRAPENVVAVILLTFGVIVTPLAYLVPAVPPFTLSAIKIGKAVESVLVVAV